MVRRPSHPPARLDYGVRNERRGKEDRYRCRRRLVPGICGWVYAHIGEHTKYYANRNMGVFQLVAQSQHRIPPNFELEPTTPRRWIAHRLYFNQLRLPSEINDLQSEIAITISEVAAELPPIWTSRWKSKSSTKLYHASSWSISPRCTMPGLHYARHSTKHPLATWLYSQTAV